MEQNCTNRKVTISDIARAVGVSKSTVSRAINCKGRISPEMRRNIQDVARKFNYLPNPSMRGNVSGRTNNIAVVLPKDAESGDVSFFQNCLMGISEAVYKNGYDTVLVVQGGGDMAPLMRVINGGKADGVILTRIEENDGAVEFLRSSGVPFVVLGTSAEQDICQIDSDQTSGCREMTKFMVEKGCTRVAVLGGNRNYLVNRWRFDGFSRGWADSLCKEEDCAVCWNLSDQDDFSEILPEIMKKNPQCLVCLDDVVCIHVLKWLKLNDYEVPADIQVISFYDNQVLEISTPPVTALYVNVSSLAKRASNLLVDLIEGKAVPHHTDVGYELRIRESFR